MLFYKSLCITFLLGLNFFVLALAAPVIPGSEVESNASGDLMKDMMVSIEKRDPRKFLHPIDLSVPVEKREPRKSLRPNDLLVTFEKRRL